MKTLETPRLLLRSWSLDDLDDFYEYAKDEKVGPNAGWPPHENKDKSLEILNSFISKDEVRAVVLKENNKVIGSIGVHEDRKRMNPNSKMIGYVLSSDYWGRGLMPEAVNEVVRFLFEEEDIDIISCYHYPFNEKSRRVIEKCGFIYEGTLRASTIHYTGQVYDDVCHSITKEEFLETLKDM